MNKIQYYSERNNKFHITKKNDLEDLKADFHEFYLDFLEHGYFQEYLGASWPGGHHLGKIGTDIASRIKREINKDNLYPIENNLQNYTEEDLFDIIEFLYRYTSKGEKFKPMSDIDYFWVYSNFDEEVGKKEFRENINLVLRRYNNGYELNKGGEIVRLANPGIELLIKNDIPVMTKGSVAEKINLAISKFINRKAIESNLHDAIRDLAGVLEYLRADIKKYLNKSDESDLFNIANNFGIRHHNQKQKMDYDTVLFHEWMFHSYLATIMLILRIKESQTTL